jgi:DNA-binding NarL/FixJ family response regulator
MRDAGLDTKILVFTMHDAEELVRAFLNVGVRGYILKSEVGRYLMAAIESVAAGKTFFADKVTATIVSGFLNSDPQTKHSAAPPPAESSHHLSSRESEVAKLLALGRSNKDIAAALAISVKTVETHRRSIMQKLEISSLVELVHWAITSHLIEPISHG